MKYLSRIGFYILLILMVDLSISWINDPYMLFHKPWIHDQYYFKDMRKQAAGIIKNHDFDSIILGTSMAQNTSITEASNQFDSNFVNLSIGGGTMSERELILKYILDKKEIKNIIISLDVFGKYEEYRADIPVESFSFLYDKNPLNDFKLYLGFKKSGYLFCGNLIFKNKCPFTVDSLNEVTEWYSDKVNSRRFGGINNWLNDSSNPQVKEALESIVSLVDGEQVPLDNNRVSDVMRNDKKVFTDYVLNYIEQNPETNFYLFFPPYHRIKHSLWLDYDPSEYEIYKKRVKLVVSLLEGYENASVFGFDNFPFVDDLSNYKDTRHYHPMYNSLILKWINEGVGELRMKNLTGYFNEIDKKASQYDLHKVVEVIKIKLYE